MIVRYSISFLASMSRIVSISWKSPYPGLLHALIPGLPYPGNFHTFKIFHILEVFHILVNILIVSYFCTKSKLQYTSMFSKKYIYISSIIEAWVRQNNYIVNYISYTCTSFINSCKYQAKLRFISRFTHAVFNQLTAPN